MLCAVDFLGIAKEAHDQWREARGDGIGDQSPGINSGGYETSEGAANVSPNVEKVLMDALRELLQPTTK